MLGGFEVGGIPAISQIALAAAINLFTTFYIALTEEVIFRGFVFSSLREEHSMFISIVFSMFLFILFHLPKWESLLSSPYLFHLIASGIVFTLIYIKSTTLWHSIGLHWGWNMGAFALSDSRIYGKTQLL
ncbi:lysostaphin resistance A-like protein [Bacillus sp. S/N-304-OC-R1]|uniref:lysostaphin resistance A-like protein n=1 Tax=Bacillus sp. S/N-304-OC-R1 TaxID=2758034 RepID=UPI0037BF0A82